MSVIIRLQNLPWSANALDIRNFFRGLSIPEGGVHIVGGELGDAFIAFSTDEDARQAMMLDGGKIKEIQVKLLLSSRSEMHKVIETARQSVPILTLTAPAPAPAVVAPPAPVTTVPATPAVPSTPIISPFSAALGTSISSFGIPGIGNPQEIPQPAVIEPPAPLISPPIITPEETDKEEEKPDKRGREKDRRRTRSRSRSRTRSRERERKDRKRDRRDRSRSRDRKDRKRDRRDRSRSRDNRRRRDRSRSRDRSPSRRSRDRRAIERKSPQNEKSFEQPENILAPPPPTFSNKTPLLQTINVPEMMSNNRPVAQIEPNRFNNDPSMADAFNKLQELGKKRNPNAFQGDQQNGGGVGGRMQGGRGGGNMGRGGANFRRETRQSRFENESQIDCCVAIRNAPNHTSYGDVRRFFPFMIDKHGIKMINDNMGRRTGNIFVRFCDSRSKHLALQRKNNELKGSEVMVEPLDDGDFENAVDSFLPYREDNGEDEPIMIQPQEEVQPPFTVVKLTDLPHFIKEHDLIKSFSDYSLLSISLDDDRVTRTKIAYVQFAKAEDARSVLERKDKYVFGRRPATITPCPDEQFEREKAIMNEKILGATMDPRMDCGGGGVVEAEREAPPRDPRQRRAAPEPPPAPAPAGLQPAGIFAPPFGQPQQFPASFPAPQYGGYPAPGAALDPRTAAANWAARPAFPAQPPPSHAAMPPPRANDFDSEPLDCVLMKGLPREATDRTIVTFLSDTGAVPARIHLMLDGNGLPSGDCFCEFRSCQEARLATAKHGHTLEGCRVTVDLVNRGVVEEALEGPKQAEPRGDGLLGVPPPHQQQPYFEPRGGFAPRGFRPRGGGGYERGGGFERSAYRGGFESPRGGFDNPRGGFDSPRGGYRGRGGFSERSGRGFDRGRGRGFHRGRGGFENGRDAGRDLEEPDSALEDFGAPGCVVSMENVPFRANVDDILAFFSDFELTQDDIIRRYNERGQPTGDARVAFRTPFDAQRAIKTRHMDAIHDRRINLTML